MAWREVETVRRPLVKQAAVKVRVTGGGGLHVAVSADMAGKLGWRKGTTLTLLVGSAESAGKIALKPKARGPLEVSMHQLRPDTRPHGRIYVGHFPELQRAAHKAEEPGIEHKNDQLILTMPEGWLKDA